MEIGVHYMIVQPQKGSHNFRLTNNMYGVQHMDFYTQLSDLTKINKN